MKIEQIQIAIVFALDEGIVLTMGQHAKALQSNMGARVQILNVPKFAPPEAPRMIIHTRNALINICLDRYNMMIRPPDHINNQLDQCCDYAQRVASDIIPYLAHDKLDYLWMGMITHIDFPLGNKGMDALGAVTPVYDRLVNIPRLGRELASFKLEVGFKEQQYFKNFYIQGYDVRNVDITKEIKEKGTGFIPIKGKEIVESGVSIIIDINNQPTSLTKIIVEDLENEIDQIKGVSANITEYLNLGGLL